MRLILRTCLFALIALALSPAAHATDSNMGETSEVLFCNGGTAPYTGCVAADLRTMADSLASPAAIFEYVRNNYDFTLYHGAHSGSVNSFLGGRGNDVDLAATLIAMLRSQGIPAHYVVGTVRAPATQVMNWLQVEDTTLAKSLMVDQGIQKVVSSTSGTTPTLDFEHVWVEALVPYGQYRGESASTVNCAATPTPSVCHWVPMDPSWKQYAQVSSGLDPYSTLSFDYTSYYNAILNADVTRMNKNPLEIYQEQVLNWLSTAAPGKTLDDIPDFQGIVTQTNGLLPASLPYAVVSSTTRFYNSVKDHDGAVPATEPKNWAKQTRLTTTLIYGGLTLQAGAGTTLLTDNATQRLTIATSTVSGTTSVIVRQGGTTIATPIIVGGTINGHVIAIGDPYTITVSMDGPPDPTGGSNDNIITATYQAVVGGYYLVATGGDSSNWSQVHRAASQLLAANTQYTIVFDSTQVGCDVTTGLNCTPYVGSVAPANALMSNLPAMDALTGGLLYVASTQYFAKLRDDFAAADRLNKVVTPISGFLGVVSSTQQTAEYINSTAFSILPSGLLIDMKGITIGGNWRINAPATVSNSQFAFIGHIVSSLEHETWQALTGYDAISTVRGIQMALVSGGSLLDLIKNTTTDTVQSMYVPMGFGTSAPSGFTLDRRSIYTTLMDSWSYATTDGTQTFTAMEKQPTSITDSRILRLTYANDYGDGNLGCFYGIQNQLTSLQTTYGPSATLNAGSLCISSYPAGTTIAGAIALNKSDYATYRTVYVGASSFDYLDETKGFNTANFLFRSVNSAAVNAQPAASVQGWRNTLYLQDLTKGWNEIQVPTILSTGPNFRFSVDISKTYDTSSNLTSATFEIQNMLGVSAGGGFVAMPRRSDAADAARKPLDIFGKIK